MISAPKLEPRYRRAMASGPIPTDHLLNAWQIVGAVATTLGVVAGAIFGVAYSRRASVSVTAEADVTPEGLVLLAITPSVGAVGPFPLKFANNEPSGAVIEVNEVLTTKDGKRTEDGKQYSAREAFPRDEKGNQQFVGQGETLRNRVFVVVDVDTPRLAGWLVYLSVESKGVRAGPHWQDRFYVPFDPSTLRHNQIGSDDARGSGRYTEETRQAREEGGETPHSPQAGFA